MRDSTPSVARNPQVCWFPSPSLLRAGRRRSVVDLQVCETAWLCPRGPPLGLTPPASQGLPVEGDESGAPKLGGERDFADEEAAFELGLQSPLCVNSRLRPVSDY